MQNTLLAGGLRSTEITPFHRYYAPLRLLVRHVSGYGFPPPLPGHRTRSVPEPNQFSQVPDVSFGARCPLRPRKVQPLKFVESRLITGFTFSERLATFTFVTRLIRVHAVRITADTFASQGSARRIAPSHAQVATWRTNNYHDQFLSTDKKRQALPDAPKTQRKQEKTRKRRSLHQAISGERFFFQILCSAGKGRSS